MKIVCIDGEAQYADIVRRDVQAPLEAAGHSFAWFEDGFSDQAAVVARASGYDALYVVGDQGPVPSGLMRANPSLKLISFVGTGARRFVDMAEALECDVTVTNVPDFASASVAEHTIALMFAVARRLPEADRDVRDGRWIKHQGLKLAGRRLGVVGAGPIAKGVIERGSALGMETVYWTQHPSAERDATLGAHSVSLEQLFATSDVVSINLAHTPATTGLITRSLLGLLSSRAILVNTARAEIVDNEFLFDLLREGRIFGAGLDVFTSEPPELSELPLENPSLVLTPHVGFHTDEADDVFRLAGENILAFASGSPTNVLKE